MPSTAPPRSRFSSPASHVEVWHLPPAIYDLSSKVFEPFNCLLKMSLPIRIVATLAIIYSQFQPAEALLETCYNAAGVPDFQIFPCQPKATESSCCKAGDICYSNGLCAPGPTEPTGITPYFLNGCTNTSFSAPDCIPSCLTSEFHPLQTPSKQPVSR
jgi:hypothetical protein